jgi:hypothetical protein
MPVLLFGVQGAYPPTPCVNEGRGSRYERRHVAHSTIYVCPVTAQQRVDALIDETATRYFDGMTVLERDIAAIDTTLSGLRAIAKAIDRLDRRLDEMDEKLDNLKKGLANVEASDNDEAIDVLARGLGLLRKKIKTMNKRKKKN